ncbi:hypothetical protein [Thiomicrorhabdus indica]|uniref:hypothetical protein n=1 Tax=Thiomicrorhabdus indica TaxID=2267253 RepID=UPI00102DA0C4|nr:hypothetical protein [Thiomicrorhabdus indica]
MKCKIFHEYDIGDLSVIVEGNENPVEIAVYIQFKAEEFFSPSVILSNSLIAKTLVEFFDFKIVNDSKGFDECIDMYEERESRTGSWYINKVENQELIQDKLLKKFLTPFYRDGIDEMGF